MPRPALIDVFSKRFLRASAFALVMGLTGALGLVGCNDGTPGAADDNGTDTTSAEARQACGAKFDPAGAKNVGKNRKQFIGGQCRNNGNCASGCCAKPCGICSGPGAQFQNGKKGCGF